MEKMVLVLHLLIAVAIIGLILLQQGKGADAGASFGSGASQTVFGSGGSWNFFSKITAILAALFFATSFALAVMAKNSAGIDTDILPELEILNTTPQPADSDIPSVGNGDAATQGGVSDIPAVEVAPGALE